MIYRTLKKMLPLGALVFMQGPLFSLKAAPPVLEAPSNLPLQKNTSLGDLPSVKDWISKCGSPSPLITLRKTYEAPLLVSDANLEIILKGKSRITFDSPLSDGRKNDIQSFDVFDEGTARLMNVHDQIENRFFGSTSEQTLSEDSRASSLQKAAYDLLEQRESDELLIMDMGISHALDVYFGFYLRDQDKLKRDKILQRQNEILYISNPVRLSTQFETPEFYDLIQSVDGVSTPLRKVETNSATFAAIYPSRLFYYAGLKRSAFSLARLKQENLTNLTTIISMDLRHINDNTAWAGLPSAKELKLAGFKKIRVGLEGWRYGKSYAMTDLEKTWKTPYAMHLRSYEIEFLKKKRPAIERRYREGFVINPSRRALQDKLISYQKEGLELRLTGLESLEIFKGQSAYDLGE